MNPPARRLQWVVWGALGLTVALIIVAFKFGADSMRAAFRYSQESILEICDQRYVQK